MPSKTAKPPEDRTSTADLENNWRKKDKPASVVKRVEFLQPDETGDEDIEEIPESVPKLPVKRAERRVVLDDDSDEDSPPVRFEKIMDIDGRRADMGIPRSKQGIPAAAPRERAYKLVAKFDDSNIVQNLVDQTKGKVLDGITVEMLAAMNGEYAKRLREITFKTRRPIKPVMMGEIPEDPFADIESMHLNVDAISVNDLPSVDSLYISTREDIGTAPGCMVCTDPILQYLSTIDESAVPKQLFYSATDAAALRVLYPTVHGVDRIECVIDSGSQIVSMSLRIAERLGIPWDPDVQIYMQSANGQLKKSVGLARNVAFLFGDITVYLQVHIIDQPAYDVLLGRPFDILTESTTQNYQDGRQAVTIRDPNQKKRVTMPTHPRPTHPTPPVKNRQARVEEVEDEEAIPKPTEKDSSVEAKADFHGSSRN